MTHVPFGLVLALAVVAAIQTRSCGYTDDPHDEGEPCARTTECRMGLECRGGVCRGGDGGAPRDAS